jgi:Protein of unknown function (DUF3891)
MLRTTYKNNIYFITQPDHAAVSGYFAAHWGNDNFTRPGYYAPTAEPEKLRAETVLGIAEHDNGWWEWEASPETDPDGLPKGLTAVLRNQEEGMNRWRLGIPRLSENHPYASLLISYHAYWLYAISSRAELNDAFIHPLFWKGSDIFAEDSSSKLSGDALENALKFVGELKELQLGLKAQIKQDQSTQGWLDTGNLHPHVRLIQLLDGLSLSICSELISAREGVSRGLGNDEFDLLHVPKKSWDERATIRVFPKGDRRIGLDPYPFDLDPLSVHVPLRILEGPIDKPIHLHPFWHSIPTELIEYEFSSA